MTGGSSGYTSTTVIWTVRKRSWVETRRFILWEMHHQLGVLGEKTEPMLSIEHVNTRGMPLPGLGRKLQVLHVASCYSTWLLSPFPSSAFFCSLFKPPIAALFYRNATIPHKFSSYRNGTAPYNITSRDIPKPKSRIAVQYHDCSDAQMRRMTEGMAVVPRMVCTQCFFM